MSGTTLLKTSALVALAAAAVALPSVANAQDAGRDRGDRGGEHRGGGNGGGGNRQAPAPAQQAPQQVQRQQQVQPQGQVQAQRNFQGRWQGQPQARPQAVPQPGAGWQGRYQGQAQVQQAVPAQRQYQGGQYQGGQYQGRNQGYADPQRNRNYGGDRRDGYRGNQYQGNQYRGGQQQAWHNDWRRDQRYNWQGYRNQNREIFRGGNYYAPYNGYDYRPLGIGFFLDQAFFGENYWIGDPGYYRLPPAYGPYRWVRYYDDVLLVNIYTGEVVDEIHDFFW